MNNRQVIGVLQERCSNFKQWERKALGIPGPLNMINMGKLRASYQLGKFSSEAK